MKKIFTIFLSLLLLCGCSLNPSKPNEPPAPAPKKQEQPEHAHEEKEPESQSEPEPEPTPEPEPEMNEIEMLLSSMSLEQKAAQLFIVRPDALDLTLTQAEIDDAKAEGVKSLSDDMAQVLSDIPVGGVVFFGKNIDSPDQLEGFLSALQKKSSTPLFTAIDEEGGLVSRLAKSPGFDLPTYESAAAVGADGVEAVYNMYNTIGGYLSEYGFNLDFAPVADVNTNPDNPIIGTRAFSSNGADAATLVEAAVKGLHNNGVLATLKHFPGHGDTATDSHTGSAVTYKTLPELREQEFLPFKAGIDAGADLIMAAHISAPNAAGDDLPASLSPTVLTDWLRGELGYDGLIITDSLAMEAVSDYYTPAQAAVMAIQAGADILLMPENLKDAHAAIVQAVKDGEITTARLDESVERILSAKEKAGILN